MHIQANIHGLSFNFFLIQMIAYHPHVLNLAFVLTIYLGGHTKLCIFKPFIVEIFKHIQRRENSIMSPHEPITHFSNNEHSVIIVLFIPPIYYY